MKGNTVSKAPVLLFHPGFSSRFLRKPQGYVGSLAGMEIAQMYVSAQGSRIVRPLRELKGFCKTELEPGESKTVRIPFDDFTFRYFDVKKNSWQTEALDYAIEIGASSEDIRLREIKHVDGIVPDEDESKTLPLYFSGKVRNVPDGEFEKLLGHKIPDGRICFIGRKRIKVGYNTTVSELRYAKGWTGRLFSGAIRFAIRLLRGIGKRSLSNTLAMGMLHQPMRGISRMTDGMLCWKQLDGLILMFNGHFFRGLHRFFHEGRVNKKLTKAEKSELAKA